MPKAGWWNQDGGNQGNRSWNGPDREEEGGGIVFTWVSVDETRLRSLIKPKGGGGKGKTSGARLRALRYGGRRK